MIKTKIEYVDYTCNPIKGICLKDCKLSNGASYCYSRRMYQRFKWPQEVTYRPEELDKIARIKNPSRIFICSTHDLFGEWIPDKWIFDIITKLQNYPQHTFLLLTKNPKRYASWTFRENFWLGQTITSGKEEIYLPMQNKISFLSIEPLLGEITHQFEPYDWIIIGALTGKDAKRFQPKQEWIENILLRNKFNIPVFMKNNLRPYYKGKFRQEFPFRRPGLMRAKL